MEAKPHPSEQPTNHRRTKKKKKSKYAQKQMTKKTQ